MKQKIILILIVVFVAGQASVLAADDSEDSNISVGIEHVCQTSVDFEPIGAEVSDYSVMAVGGSDNFTATISNEANSGDIDGGRANISVDTINITWQGNGSYESTDFEEPGAMLSNGTYWERPVHRYTNFTEFNNANNSTNVPPRNVLENYTVEENGTNVTEVRVAEWRNNTFLRSFNRSEADYTGAIGAGWYTARLYGDINCRFESNSTDFNANFNFKLIELDEDDSGASEQGPEQDEQNPADGPDANGTGDPFESNATNPGGNGTHPTDANETGGEGDPVEGDNDQPGQTPEPEPEPDPVPMLSLDIEPNQSVYTARRGQFTSVNLTLTNEGDAALSQLSILPQISEIREGWEANNAQVANLAPGENVTREVLIRPPEDEDAGSYVIPVLGRNQEQDLDVDYFQIELLDEAVFSSSMSITEAPRSVTLIQNSTQSLPILVENTGGTNLTNISARLQNAGQCGSPEVSGTDEIGVNESGSININFESISESQSCNTTLIVSSDEGAYSFSNIEISVTPEEGLIPEEYRVPFIAIAWTSLLAAAAVLRRRYELNSVLFKGPFVLLIMGETLIFLYLVVDYYGLVAASFLPF